MTWKVVAGSATGSGHEAKGEPCQDASDWFVRDKWLVAVVCDGAGSAKFSATGALHGAQSMCRELGRAVPTYRAPLTNAKYYWEARIKEAVANTRRSLKSEHIHSDMTLRDFHATLVGVVIGPGFGTFFQIGDGVGAAVQGVDWENVVLSLPENGQFADETFFYTEEHWQKHLRFVPIPPETQLITLMTDGAMSFAMAPKLQGLDRKFIEPVTRYLDEVDAETGNQALTSTLDDPRTHTITSDDKTLLWARRQD